MAFKFKRTESIGDGIRRIAAEQLDRAIASVTAVGADMNVVVHGVRRRCKRVRAVVRLARNSLARSSEHEAWLRDTAALLSRARDAAVLPKTHAVVAANVGEGIDDYAAARVLESLQAQFRAETELPLDTWGATVETVRSRLVKARCSVDGWRIDGEGFDAIGTGLQATYSRARNAMRKARRSSSTADCHRWRKGVKYHGFHVQLIRGVWPCAMQARLSAAEELGDLLGRIHDLAVYRAAIDGAMSDDAAASQLRPFRNAADRLGTDLLLRCWPLGQRLFVLTPKTFAEEQETYWRAWRAERTAETLRAPQAAGAVGRAARRIGG